MIIYYVYIVYTPDVFSCSESVDKLMYEISQCRISNYILEFTKKSKNYQAIKIFWFQAFTNVINHKFELKNKEKKVKIKHMVIFFSHTCH